MSNDDKPDGKNFYLSIQRTNTEVDIAKMKILKITFSSQMNGTPATSRTVSQHRLQAMTSSVPVMNMMMSEASP